MMSQIYNEKRWLYLLEFRDYGVGDLGVFDSYF